MADAKMLKNKELEKVAGGTSVTSFDGFSIGDWVAYKPGTRYSPHGGGGLSRPHYRISELYQHETFATAKIDVYELSPLGGYDKFSGDSCSTDDLVHANSPLGFDD